MKFDRKVAALVTAVVMIPVAAVGLSGCVPSTDTTPAPSGIGNSQTDPHATESPAPTKAPVAAAVKVGEVIAPGDVAAIKAKSADTGNYPYAMSNGSFIMTNSKQDAPAVVKQDIAATAAPIAASLATVAGSGQNGVMKKVSIKALALQKGTELGKKVIVIYPTQTQSQSGNWTPVWATLSGESSPTGVTPGGKDATTALANQWAQQYNGVVIVIVVG